MIATIERLYRRPRLRYHIGMPLMPSRSNAFTRRHALAGIGALTLLSAAKPAFAIDPPAKRVADVEAKLGAASASMSAMRPAAC